MPDKTRGRFQVIQMQMMKAPIWAVAVLGLCVSTDSLAFSNSQFELARNTAGDCQLSRPGAPPRLVSADEEIMYFPPDGIALTIDGSACTMSAAPDVVLAPATTKQQKEQEFLKVFWGAFSALTPPNTYREIGLQISLDGKDIAPPDGSSYSFWLGMQPPINFAGADHGGMSKAEWRKQNKWGNLAIHPTLQVGELGTFARQKGISFSDQRPYIFNTFCDAGISSCPIDGPRNVVSADDGFLTFAQSAKYTGKEDFFPQSWIATTASDDLSLVFVVPDASVNEIFDRPNFCATGACKLPVGLLEQEIRAHETLTAEQIPDLFPSRVEVRLENLVQSQGSDPVQWSFPKSFEITGTVVGEKIILSLDDLKGHIDGLDSGDSAAAPLRCLHAILTSMNQRQQGDDGRTFLWTIDRDQPQCSASAN
jgi:hypothetical protein